MSADSPGSTGPQSSPPAPVRLAVPATYDAEADALYVYLQAAIEPDEVTTTVPVSLTGDGTGVLLELDAAGRLVGLEVLHGATTLPAELLRQALTPSPANCRADH